MDEHQRSLTDEDVQALADEMEKRMVSRFYSNVGQGVWAVAWKVILYGLVLLASYGVVKGLK